VAEKELWEDILKFSMTSGLQEATERQLDIQQDEWLRGKCGAAFGFIAG